LHHAFYRSGGCDRPDHHDRAAAGLLEQRHRELGQLERALDVDVRDRGPIIEVAIEEPADRRVERRDVHQSVEPAERRSRRGHHLAAGRERTYVCLERDSPALVGVDLPEHRLQPVTVEVAEHHAGPRRNDVTRHLAAQPRPDARHQDHLVLECAAPLGHRTDPASVLGPTTSPRYR
jgi:hypothetical protein